MYKDEISSLYKVSKRTYIRTCWTQLRSNSVATHCFSLASFLSVLSALHKVPKGTESGSQHLLCAFTQPKSHVGTRSILHMVPRSLWDVVVTVDDDKAIFCSCFAKGEETIGPISLSAGAVCGGDIETAKGEYTCDVLNGWGRQVLEMRRGKGGFVNATVFRRRMSHKGGKISNSWVDGLTFLCLAAA